MGPYVRFQVIAIILGNDPPSSQRSQSSISTTNHISSLKLHVSSLTFQWLVGVVYMRHIVGAVLLPEGDQH